MRFGNFFRVFDTCFFVPGLVLIGGLWYLQCVPESGLLENDTIRTSVFLAVLVAVVYVAGLLTHAVNRLGFKWFFASSRKPADDPAAAWFQRLSQDQREELAVYFWHTRATCGNVGVACVLLAGLAFHLAHPSLWGFLIVSALCFAISTEYHESLGRAMSVSESEEVESD